MQCTIRGHRERYGFSPWHEIYCNSLNENIIMRYDYRVSDELADAIEFRENLLNVIHDFESPGEIWPPIDFFDADTSMIPIEGALQIVQLLMSNF